MKTNISDFHKKFNYLVCVDSDGCAMDTMDIKHIKCFGPEAVKEWGLDAYYDRFMEVWNHVNLYSKTRGINRFKGLVMTLELLKEEGLPISDISEIAHWTKTSDELSNLALERAIAQSGSEQLKKVLTWSIAVNKSIKELPEEDKPFPNVLETLTKIGQVADVAIVSSANGGAVVSEWTRHGLAPIVQVMLGQEAGSKAFCIQELKKFGFSDNYILMVGDAPGDLDAAMTNGVLYYPILVGKEGFSWKRLAEEALDKLLKGDFRGQYQDQLIEEFNSTLK